MTDISWYTKYLSDGDTDVDLDELVRVNEIIRERLGQLTEVKRFRWKKHSRNNQARESSFRKKRERRPLVRNIGNRQLSQFLRVPSRSTESAPQASKTLNGFEARPFGAYSEAQPQPIVKKSVVRYGREHSREDANQEWHRQNSTESEDEDAQKSPVIVSNLVSKFESVRRRNAFSNGKTKTTNDPYSSLERKVSNRDKEDNHRRSIRVILRNSTPLNQTDSTIDGSLHQTHVTPPHEVHTVIPQRTSEVTKTDIPLFRLKSEGHSRVYPANLGGLHTIDQFSRTPSDSKSLKKGYSFDYGYRTQKPEVHRQTTFASNHLESPVAPTHNHTSSVVFTLPTIPVHGTNIRRAHSDSKGNESYRSIYSRSSFDKKPDATRQMSRTNTIVEEATDYHPTPLWRSEVEMRKKTKSYVSAHKPEQPMQLGSVPEWKRLLLEKNKQKRGSIENQHDHFNTRITKPDTNINFTEPAWKQEFDKIRRQVVSAHESNHHAGHVFEREIPEWVKLAELRRRAMPLSDNEDS